MTDHPNYPWLGQGESSPLAAAYEDLLVRCQICDDAEDWHERSILEHLADVADYVKRVGDHPDSSHYRAEKSGPLIDAAIRVQRQAMLAYAAWPDYDHETHEAIHGATQVLLEAAVAVRMFQWVAAATYRGPLYRSTAREILDAAANFSHWAKTVTANAAPDPAEGEW